MSTTTNFKRIALVAVAALGLGVLSAVPSSAAVSGVTVTVTNGTSTLQTGTTGGKSDTSTAAVINVTGLQGSGDSITVTAAAKSVPTGASRVALLGILDTNTTSGWARTDVDDLTKMSTTLVLTGSGAYVTDSETIATAAYTLAGGSAGYVGARFFLQLESGTGTTIAGTYTYTVTVKSVSYEAAQSAYSSVTQTSDVSIVVADLASASLVANPSFSTAYIGTTTGNTTDSIVNALSTASDTPRGYLTIKLRNASGVTDGTAARESVTITTTIGQVGTSTNRGRSVVLAYDASSVDYNIYSDGTAGTGTITISTPSVTFSTKTVSFYAANPATLVASVPTPNLKIGSNSDSVRVTAKDSNGNLWTGDLYVYASTAADALIAGSNSTPTVCSFDTGTDQRHECTITGNLAGTAKLKVINASTVAAATVTSNEVSVVVNGNAAASVKLSFDKATYAPGERARIYVTPVDSAGKEIAANTYSNLLATGGISTAASLSYGPAGTTQADSLTAVSITTSANASSTTGARAGSAVYTVYMPTSGATVTISATGGSSLPLSGQVAVTASATVTDSGAAALAAVTALATTVASLKTLITTLTNLVLKIQKKVKA